MQRLEQLHSQLSENKTASEEVDIFAHITLAPADPILGITQAYKADTSSLKVDLGVGAYRTDEEKPYVFEIVKKVEREIINDNTLNKEYLPIDGLAEYNKFAQQLMFGKGSRAIAEGRVVTAQALGGTGALRLGFEFLNRYLPGDVYLSNPTWGNHNAIVERAGMKQLTYPYYDAKTRGFDFNGMVSTLSKARYGSIVLLHVCAHNPTGVDPTEEQWLRIADVCRQRKLVPFFDCAYQGFASGDLDKDMFSLRTFVEQGFQMVVAQSFSKNLGLYNERVGAVHLVTSSKDVSTRVLSQLKTVIRTTYSNPSAHGARIAAKTLGSEQNFEAWRQELSAVTGRIIRMRALLKEELLRNGTPGDWSHITNQKGFFTYTGLSVAQCEILTKKYHVYLLKNGRMSMAGITSKNVQHLANAMKQSILESQQK